MKLSKQILIFEFLYCIGLLLSCFFAGDFSESLHGFIRILCSSSQLTVDYFAIGTIGGTFFNAAIVGFSCIFLQKILKAELNGTSIMAFFLTVGFSFFGINFLNIWPCFLGTALFSAVSKQPFSSVVNTALFSTSLAPFVSELFFFYPGIITDSGRVFLGILIGVLAGFLLPVLCLHGPQLHKGYSLYNAASVAGFIGIMFFSFLYRFRGIEAPSQLPFDSFSSRTGLVFCLISSAFMIVFGFILNGRSFSGVKELLRVTGYQCDFTASCNFGLILMNIGLFGIFTEIYYIFIQATFSSATVGAMICFLALAPCGAHVLNMLPIMLGYILISFFGCLDLNAPAMIIGFCFSASLVPVSGRFGSLSGIIAGMLHAVMVTTVVTFHGGFVLYNGGFTAGITAIILIPVLEYFFVPLDYLAVFPKYRKRTNLK